MLTSYVAKPVAAALMLAWAHCATATVISQLDMKSAGEINRLTLEAPVGMLIDTSIAGRGDSVLIKLKGGEKENLLSYFDNLKKNPLVKNARILPGGLAEEVTLLIELKKAVSVLDETIVALPGKVSRWELVLVDAPKEQIKANPAALSQLSVVRRDGRFDLALTGSTGLTVEASIQDSPPRLIIELPEVPLAQASAAAARFHGEVSLLKSVKASAMQGGSRLTFDLSETVDLVDTRGLIVGEQGEVVLGLVPDGRVSAASVGRLGALGFESGDGVMQLRLAGTSGSRVSAYTIENPPRLVVDFIGWTPEQVKDALAQFGGKSSATLGAPMLDTTRLGSARAVFDLAVSAPFRNARPVRLPVEGSPDVYADNMLISLDPSAAPPSQNLLARGPLDLRYRRELHDGRQSEVIIRPPVLENAERFAEAALRPERSREYALMGLLSKAMESDSKYQAAKSEFEAMQELLPQARAGYLPTASFDYQRSTARQNVIEAPNAAFPKGSVGYPNTSMTLTLTQAIFKPQAWIKIDQAELAVEQARLNVAAAEQDLIMRVASAYLNVMAATDGVELARAEREATEKQYDQAKARIESGLGTVSQLHDTEARLSLTKAREIEAANRVDDARLAVKEIIGEDVSSVRGFKADFDASEPMPSAVEPWVEASLEQNLALQGRKLATEIAALEITRQRAGHLPTVSLVGNVSRQDSGGSLYGGGQKSDNAELGVRVSIPITDGGMTMSLGREAVARKEKAEHEREQERRRTERVARSAFNGVVTSAKTLSALRQSVVAQESALETRIEGFNSGLYNVVAVMDAYRLYYAAQRDFLQARYDYVVNRLKLRQSVGALSRADLEAIAVLMQ